MCSCSVRLVLDAMIRDWISLARSVELTAQWDEIIRVVPVNPITLEDFESARCGGLGEFRRVTGDLHCRLSDFIHRVVVHRSDDAIRGWRNWVREDPLVHFFKKWLETGIWPEAYVALIPKTDGDATPLGQRPLSVLPVVIRSRASARMVQL